ncbi:peptide deformylase [Coprothermobacteraceae bacterium]|nr:peptide deformylase [Coprothermobacteraceae bacterium]
MDIRVVPDTILRAKADKVKSVTRELQELIDRMYAAMKDNEVEGVGLAAPQVGVPLRLVVIEYEGFKEALINPKWEPAGEEVDEDLEGCLSVPGLYGLVKRYRKIRLSFTDALGKKHRVVLEGMVARIVQHEVDHLDGILFTDKITDWDSVEVTPLALKHPGVVEILKSHQIRG